MKAFVAMLLVGLGGASAQLPALPALPALPGLPANPAIPFALPANIPALPALPLPALPLAAIPTGPPSLTLPGTNPVVNLQLPAGRSLLLPATAASSQHHAQDELGNLDYGYSNVNSAKRESGNTYGGVTGSYSYVDANGLLQTTEYVADANGFRARSTNLPVAPTDAGLEPPVFELVQVEDTPEVAAAKAEFRKAFDEQLEATQDEGSRRKRSLQSAYPASTGPLIRALAPAPAVVTYTAAAPAVVGYPATPLLQPAATPLLQPAVALPAPASRAATLTTIKLTPGHAVAYKVE